MERMGWGGGYSGRGEKRSGGGTFKFPGKAKRESGKLNKYIKEDERQCRTILFA